MDEKFLGAIILIVSGVGTGAYFLLKWFTKTLTKKDESLERLAERSNQIVEKNSTVISEHSQLLRDIKTILEGRK